MKEHIEGNRLIAEFEGNEVTRIMTTGTTTYSIPHHSYQNTFCGDTYEETEYDDVDLLYHSSYDWIMPVVEKIVMMNISTCRVWVDTFRCKKNHPDTEFHYKVRIHDDSRVILNIKTHSNSEIEAIWQAVVEFIKWYNDNK